jgi:N-acetylmuramoyl-L-alanine amidase
VVVLDAGHGGDDPGARSRDGVTERDLMASLVDLVRASLGSAGKFRVVLTRTGSSDPSPDERDAVANLARPVAFLTFHAGDLGGKTPAIEIYTYQAPSPTDTPQGLFVPWTEAQEAHLVRSRDLASLLVQQLGRVEGLEARSPDEAPERQLRSVDAPAVAIELGTLDPGEDAAALRAPSLQNQIATAVAQALDALLQGAG